jgi:hypothetical protein
MFRDERHQIAGQTACLRLQKVNILERHKQRYSSAAQSASCFIIEAASVQARLDILTRTQVQEVTAGG